MKAIVRGVKGLIFLLIKAVVNIFYDKKFLKGKYFSLVKLDGFGHLKVCIVKKL